MNLSTKQSDYCYQLSWRSKCQNQWFKHLSVYCILLSCHLYPKSCNYNSELQQNINLHLFSVEMYYKTD